MALKLSMNAGMKIPSYSGQGDDNWDQFLYSIKIASLGLAHPTDNTMKSLLLGGLRGAANEYCQAHPELIEMTYEQLISHLSEKFEKDKRGGHVKLHEISQRNNESIFEYHTRLQNAAQGLLKRPIPEGLDQNAIEILQRERVATVGAMVLPYFLKGLKNNIRETVMIQRPTNMTDALKIAHEQEKYMQQLGVVEELKVMHINEDSVVNQASEVLTNLNKTNTSRKNYISNNVTCYKCGEKGHYSNNCNEIITCLYCGMKGHVVVECKMRKEDNQKRDEGRQPRKNVRFRSGSRDRKNSKSRSGSRSPKRSGSPKDRQKDKETKNGESFRLKESPI